MEFFKLVEVSTTEKVIREKLTLGNLEQFCESIFALDENADVCLTGGMWGEFTVRRDPIMGGIRFSMLNCPNALAWTINRERKQEEFVEEIHLFLEDLANGIASYFS